MSVIFLNGCTSAGKSSVAKAVQDQLSAPFLLTGIDDAFSMLPANLHNNPDGFFFDRDRDGLVRLNFGSFGSATLKAHIRSVAAIARTGMNLILDEVILTADLRKEWVEHLSGTDVMLVGVRCDLQELERRERERGDRVIGQARGQYNIVHADMCYDLEIDTTSRTTKDAANIVIDTFLQKSHGNALKLLAKRRS